jgi:hypothetical protein
MQTQNNFSKQFILLLLQTYVQNRSIVKLFTLEHTFFDNIFSVNVLGTNSIKEGNVEYLIWNKKSKPLDIDYADLILWKLKKTYPCLKMLRKLTLKKNLVPRR